MILLIKLDDGEEFTININHVSLVRFKAKGGCTIKFRDGTTLESDSRSVGETVSEAMKIAHIHYGTLEELKKQFALQGPVIVHRGID